MYKKYIIAGLVCGLFSFTSCKHANDDAEPELGAGMIRMDLTPLGIPATIDIPDTTKKPHAIEALPSGDIHVSVDRGFNMLINVSGMDMDRKKKDIAGNDVDKFQSWVVQDSNAILYKTQMVNEEFHFYSIIKKGGKAFYAYDQTQGSDGNVTNFSQKQAHDMLDAAKTLHMLKPAAKS